ncbi:GntP family permease [Ferrimonas gelatinilytica]|uniref:GntP family permease n=1 Tax=Ferrimonas gelatinilytica TaxID=1255257 RepID=A0ABP9SBB4_9GAMM
MAIGILVALCLFIYLAMRGTNIVLASLICSTTVVLTTGIPFDKAMLEYFPAGALGAFTFAGKFFLLFIAGAMFGKAMGVSGSASRIANALVDWLGTERAIWITVIFTSVLTYGGVVVFVVIFAMYPIGVQLLAKANMPKRLFTGAMALGVGTYTMTALPGSPSIHNVISSVALDTDLFAAPGYGLFGSALMIASGMVYLEWQRKKALANGEGFVPTEKDKLILASDESQVLPPLWTSILPLASVLVLIVGTKILASMDIEIAGLVAYSQAQPIIWPSLALLGGVAITLLLSPRLRRNALDNLGAGAEDAILPLIATSVVIGFGGVVSQTEAFQWFTKSMTEVDMPVLLSVFIAASAVSAVVGSSTGGLQIFLATMAPDYLAKGVEPEVLHRVAAMASGGFDSLPHCGAIVTVLAVTGLTHKEGYKDIGVVTVLFPVMATLSTIALVMMN